MKNESNVNYYAKVFPSTFEYGKGDIVTDTEGKEYIDFFCGAGSLNYGHNNPVLKEAVFSFLKEDRILHCLDMDSKVKEEFLKKFDSVILKPRNLDYKIQFPGPTGTNAVEAAIRLSRIVTKRQKIVAFTNSFHGMTAMSLAASASKEDAQEYNSAQEVLFFPYDNFGSEVVNTIEYLKLMIATPGSGVMVPAAIILETVQAEGGVNVANRVWLQELRTFTQENGILLIIDDIQVGCGRTGTFFSFENAGIVPDIVLLSKSISGLGLPLSLVLIKDEFDQWRPGEHNGTFRANNLSLCAACEALNFWNNREFANSLYKKSEKISCKLTKLKNESEWVVDIRGVGMIWGIEFSNKNMAKRIARQLFDNGVLIELCGQYDHVLKILPPLTISEDHLEVGLNKLIESVLNYEYTVPIALE